MFSCLSSLTTFIVDLCLNFAFGVMSTYYRNNIRQFHFENDLAVFLEKPIYNFEN